MYLYATSINVENVNDMTQRLFSVGIFSSMLKKFPTVFRFILGALAKKDFQQSYPAISVSPLKLFEIPIYLTILYPVARTPSLCGANPFAQIV
jgi:hypothetical protein